MEAEDVLYRLGGVATHAALVRATSRSALARALRRGRVARDGRGRYALPTADQALRTASALTGAVSFRSAAAHWGWEQKSPPEKPEVTVPRKRRVSPEVQRQVTVHWADVKGTVTSKRRTLEDCLRLPFDEALAIADSALRHRDVDKPELLAIAQDLRGPGSARARAVAAAADARAANPFESVLRAIALPVRGLEFEPQLPITLPTGTVYVDLADPVRHVVAEADSFTWHGSRGALARDCRRYNRLALRGWLVLRFTWEDVMFHPDYVRNCLTAAANTSDRQAQRVRRRPRAA